MIPNIFYHFKIHSLIIFFFIPIDDQSPRRYALIDENSLRSMCCNPATVNQQPKKSGDISLIYFLRNALKKAWRMTRPANTSHNVGYGRLSVEIGVSAPIYRG